MIVLMVAIDDRQAVVRRVLWPHNVCAYRLTFRQEFNLLIREVIVLREWTFLYAIFFGRGNLPMSNSSERGLLVGMGRCSWDVGAANGSKRSPWPHSAARRLFMFAFWLRSTRSIQPRRAAWSELYFRAPNPGQSPPMQGASVVATIVMRLWAAASV